METIFHDFTSAWSADTLLADFAASRQLRHMSVDARRELAEELFKGRRFVRATEGFGAAVVRHGYSCDCCPAVVPVDQEHASKAANRMLDNLDGRVRLMLCLPCSRHFASFCRREFNEADRQPYSDALEQMMVAFIASEIKRVHSRGLRQLGPDDARRG